MEIFGHKWYEQPCFGCSRLNLNKKGDAISPQLITSLVWQLGRLKKASIFSALPSNCELGPDFVDCFDYAVIGVRSLVANTFSSQRVFTPGRAIDLRFVRGRVVSCLLLFGKNYPNQPVALEDADSVILVSGESMSPQLSWAAPACPSCAS